MSDQAIKRGILIIIFTRILPCLISSTIVVDMSGLVKTTFPLHHTRLQLLKLRMMQNKSWKRSQDVAFLEPAILTLK